MAHCCEAGACVMRPGWSGAGTRRPSGTPPSPWVAVRYPRAGKHHPWCNLFSASLASADLVVAMFYDGWEHSKASTLVMSLISNDSIFNINTIAINRYCCICDSVAYHHIYWHWHTPLHICLIWLLWWPCCPTLWGPWSMTHTSNSCTFIQTASTRYTVAVVVIHFLLPFTVPSYLRVGMLVLQARGKAKPESRLCLRPSDLLSFLTVFVVVMIFAFCWAPLNCIGLAAAINPQEMAPQIPEGLFVTSYLLVYFNSCLNAIVYGVLNQNFLRSRGGTHGTAFRMLQNASKGSQAEGLQSPAPPITGIQHPAQAHAL
uniref:Melatonin receptor 1B n=1 Tax=Saimiri boliviensis boliviensis TaxID=39432 RepID=A0A2K6SKY2_SAIBB